MKIALIHCLKQMNWQLCGQCRSLVFGNVFQRECMLALAVLSMIRVYSDNGIIAQSMIQPTRIMQRLYLIQQRILLLSHRMSCKTSVREMEKEREEEKKTSFGFDENGIQFLCSYKDED